MKKQILALLLAVIMAFALFSFSALAVEPEVRQEGNYRYTVQDGEATLVGCENAEGALVLPEKLGGCPVTTIGSDAFYQCSDITSVTVPQSVRRVLDGAFASCENLTELLLPEGLEYLGGNVLADTFGVEQLKLPSTLREMGIGCLSYSGLTEVVVPEGITSLPSDAMLDCSALRSVSLPSTLKTIGGQCFYGCYALEDVTIPDSVTELGGGSFAYCSALRHVKLSANLTTLSYGLFQQCTALETVDLPAKLKSIEGEVFGGCGELASLELPDSVTSIGGGAFFSCGKLTELYLPEGITEIPENVFCGCVGLKGCFVPKGVKSIGPGAFEGCSAMEWIILPDSIRSLGVSCFAGCSALTYLRIPVSVTELPEQALARCSALETLVIPRALRTIHQRAFADCNALSVIGYPGTEKDLDKLEVYADGNEVLQQVQIALIPSYPDYLYGLYDMPAEDNWAYDGIAFCLDTGLMQGMGQGYFRPSGTTTRAQLVTILWRMCGEPKAAKKLPFTDCGISWADPAIAWASENGIVSGIGQGKFGPNQPITREQLVTIFYRFCKEYLDIDVSVSQSISAYPDAKSVSAWAKDAMQWGTAVKLISGVASSSGTLLQPGGSATRAQIARIILNFTTNVAPAE